MDLSIELFSLFESQVVIRALDKIDGLIFVFLFLFHIFIITELLFFELIYFWLKAHVFLIRLNAHVFFVTFIFKKSVSFILGLFIFYKNI